MMITATGEMKKRYHILCAVAQSHAEHTGVEIDFVLDICREREQMTEVALLEYGVASWKSPRDAALNMPRIINAPFWCIGPRRRFSD